MSLRRIADLIRSALTTTWCQECFTREARNYRQGKALCPHCYQFIYGGHRTQAVRRNSTSPLYSLPSVNERPLEDSK